jgi:hypothetical protein
MQETARPSGARHTPKVPYYGLSLLTAAATCLWPRQRQSSYRTFSQPGGLWATSLITLMGLGYHFGGESGFDTLSI